PITYEHTLRPIDVATLKSTSNISDQRFDSGVILFDDGQWNAGQTGVVQQFNNGQLVSTPADGMRIKKVVAGNYHYLAIKSDGSVIAWMAQSGGDIDYSDCMITYYDGCEQYIDYNQGQAIIPASITCAHDIAAGDYFSVALTCDGKVVQWGNPPAAVPALLANANSGVVRAVFAHTNQAVALV
ncbi:MAG: hypothetical protein ACK46D_11825, partial [Roseiflexaceae bacterium]